MNTDLRWQNYVLRCGKESSQLWRELFKANDRKVLYILGLGFDPRMCNGLKDVLESGGVGKLEVRLLTFDGAKKSPLKSNRQRTRNNRAELKRLIKRQNGKLSELPLELRSKIGEWTGDRNIAREFDDPSKIDAYTDVIVDVSALPRGLYFPLIAKLLKKFDQYSKGQKAKNLHVIVSHSPILDASIQDKDVVADATYLDGFSKDQFECKAKGEQPVVWLPVLGRAQSVQLERIHKLVNPKEICPVLPSPADNPREADDLLLEYREFLFEELSVEPRNIIYASESNPFEVYRRIVGSVNHYRRVLEPLGGCKSVVSAMSSKLSSIGALLAAYDLQDETGNNHVGVAHVQAQGYRLEQLRKNPEQTLHTLWLAGEAYG